MLSWLKKRMTDHDEPEKEKSFQSSTESSLSQGSSCDVHHLLCQKSLGVPRGSQNHATCSDSKSGNVVSICTPVEHIAESVTQIENIHNTDESLYPIEYPVDAALIDQNICSIGSTGWKSAQMLLNSSDNKTIRDMNTLMRVESCPNLTMEITRPVSSASFQCSRGDIKLPDQSESLNPKGRHVDDQKLYMVITDSMNFDGESFSSTNGNVLRHMNDKDTENIRNINLCNNSSDMSEAHPCDSNAGIYINKENPAVVTTAPPLECCNSPLDVTLSKAQSVTYANVHSTAGLESENIVKLMNMSSESLQYNEECLESRVEKCSVAMMDDDSKRGQDVENTPASYGNEKVFTLSVCKYSCPCCSFCLYKQSGKLCTIEGKQYIFTVYCHAPLLVSLEETSKFLLQKNVPVLLSQLEDGTDVMFDAALLPLSLKMVAIIVWQDTKPSTVLYPTAESLIYVEEVLVIQVQFVKFIAKTGVLEGVIDGQIESIIFSRNVVYLNGRKSKGIGEVRESLKCPFIKIFATVNKFIKVKAKAFVFIATCVWTDIMPSGLKKQYLIPGQIYSLISGYKYVLPVRYTCLHCDIPCILHYKKNKYEVEFTFDGKVITRNCSKEALCCGNNKVILTPPYTPFKIKARAHLLENKTRKSKFNCSVIMVQVPSAHVVMFKDHDLILKEEHEILTCSSEVAFDSNNSEASYIMDARGYMNCDSPENKPSNNPCTRSISIPVGYLNVPGVEQEKTTHLKYLHNSLNDNQSSHGKNDQLCGESTSLTEELYFTSLEENGKIIHPKDYNSYEKNSQCFKAIVHEPNFDDNQNHLLHSAHSTSLSSTCQEQSTTAPSRPVSQFLLESLQKKATHIKECRSDETFGESKYFVRTNSPSSSNTVVAVSSNSLPEIAEQASPKSVKSIKSERSSLASISSTACNTLSAKNCVPSQVVYQAHSLTADTTLPSMEEQLQFCDSSSYLSNSLTLRTHSSQSGESPISSWYVHASSSQALNIQNSGDQLTSSESDSLTDLMNKNVDAEKKLLYSTVASRKSPMSIEAKSLKIEIDEEGSSNTQIYLTKCKIKQLARSSGVAKANEKGLSLSTLAHFHHSTVCIEGEPIVLDKTLLGIHRYLLHDILDPYKKVTWMCLIEKCTPSSVCNVQVNYTVCLMWLGRTPTERYNKCLLDRHLIEIYPLEDIFPQIKKSSAASKEVINSSKLYATSGKIIKITKGGGILKGTVNISGSSPVADFRKFDIYINKKRLSLVQQDNLMASLEPYIGEIWKCLIVKIRKRCISKVAVDYYASLIWLGDLPTHVYQKLTKNFDVIVKMPENSQDNDFCQQNANELQSSLVLPEDEKTLDMGQCKPVYQKGIIKELLPRCGFLEGDVKFIRQRCFLYGIPLKNILLNEVLAVGEFSLNSL
ncbi:hypothetical protein SK128_004723 [Halocaridina rubra]|uniref:Uncharacterized protein n=1 Tax=Halocaridina rubra TaxID=373956 RepID=A0AAN9AC52_HALRR